MKAVDRIVKQQERLTEKLETDRHDLSEITWGAFRTRLRRYVGKRVPAEDVDDVVGDVLVKLVRSREAFEAVSNLSAWILRVAANTVADYYRHRSMEQAKRSSLDYEYLLSMEKEGESSDTSTRAISGCLTPFIQNLPAAYAETLILTDIGGMKQSEAARQLNVSLSAVKSRVQRGRAKLKQALLRCCELELDRRGRVINYRPRGACCTGQ